MKAGAANLLSSLANRHAGMTVSVPAPVFHSISALRAEEVVVLVDVGIERAERPARAPANSALAIGLGRRSRAARYRCRRPDGTNDELPGRGIEDGTAGIIRRRRRGPPVCE